MDCLQGKVKRPTSRNAFALATQDSWLEQNTILENILFGTPYDEKRFEKVVEACALLPDFARWALREHTEIGERGVSLSGGQRARVALARAIYSHAPCVLLDDP
jgi:ABC-type transport system involved in cytochrome bd biosynthesis fused ATPase/permease subunit